MMDPSRINSQVIRRMRFQHLRHRRSRLDNSAVFRANDGDSRQIVRWLCHVTGCTRVERAASPSSL